MANRRKVRNGEDPRKRNPVAMRQASKSAPDFKTAAEAASWTNPKSAGQWRASLATYAYPVLGKLGVDAVTTADVLAVPEPIWTAKRETAGRIRQRISAVMRWAKAKGHRADDPAGDEVLLVLGTKRAAPKHHRAIHYPLAGDALRKVGESNAWSATKMLFEYMVLTRARRRSSFGYLERSGLGSGDVDGSRGAHESRKGTPRAVVAKVRSHPAQSPSHAAHFRHRGFAVAVPVHERQGD